MDGSLHGPKLTYMGVLHESKFSSLDDILQESKLTNMDDLHGSKLASLDGSLLDLQIYGWQSPLNPLYMGWAVVPQNHITSNLLFISHGCQSPWLFLSLASFIKEISYRTNNIDYLQ